MYKYPKCT